MRLEDKKLEVDTSWYIFKGDIDINDLNEKSPPPSWRGEKSNYLPTDEEVATVNASIYLRRPLLLTGRPGTGKSSLAHAIAEELGLEIETWAINSKTSLEDGLYQYDAISRLHDAQREDEKAIEEYVSLGPLGKAFARGERSVLLIDELDKSDIDLPNDLLHILEESEFDIPVLKRYKKEKKVNLGTKDKPIWIEEGKKNIDILNLPIIIITSNKERDFSQAFMRRCLHHNIELPMHDRLVDIACKHLEEEYKDKKEEYKNTIKDLVTSFLERREKNELATDQLLNAVYLMFKEKVDVSKSEILKKTIWHSLDS